MKIPLSPFATLRLLLLLPILSLARPAAAQNIPQPLADFAAVFPVLNRVEGSIEITTNGANARAQLQWEAPDKLRIEVLQSDNSRAQIVVAAGDETRFYDPATKRVQRVPFNLARQWWRGGSLTAGGPANFVFAALAPASTAPFYASKAPNAGTLLLTAQNDAAKTQTRRLVSDSVKFGGSGDRIFYAPFKRWIWNRPSQISLKTNAARTKITREETDDGGQIFTTNIVLDANGLPQSATTSDAKNRVVSDWKYQLQIRAEDFPAATFSFEFAPNLLVEDGQLKTIAEYSAGGSAADKYNLGAALARQAEDWPAAFAAWEEAARLSTTATAAQFAIYDGALATRDLNRADKALDALSTFLGEDTPEVSERRVAVLLARRDWAKSQAILEKSVRLRPQDSARLLLADVLRARADFAGAQAQLLEILKNPDGAGGTKARAAEMLALLATGKSADGVLPALPPDTLWQKLARAHIALQNGQPSSLETDDLHALESLAMALERGGRDGEAIAAWTKILERTPFPSDKNARLHLMALHAQRGEVELSFTQYRALVDATTSQQARGEFQDALIGAWRKSVRQAQLKSTIEQRAIATGASEDDALLWLKYQENFGSRDAIGAAIKNGLGRFDRSAWWRGRQAEFIAGQIPQTADANARERLQREAQDAAESAIALDSEQPYYAIERALLLTQRATPATAILDPKKTVPARKAANDELNLLLEKWPNDADVRIAVASQKLALEDDGAHDESIALLRSALLQGTPDSAGDRHFIAFSSRQVLASALRRDKKNNDELTGQYLTLFQASRSADEELGVALNYFRWLINRKQVKTLTAALITFAREPWAFDDSQQLIQPLIYVIAAQNAEAGEADYAAQVLAVLQASDDPYARLLTAYFQSNAAFAARQIAAQPEAPANADLAATKANAALKTALEALAPLVDGDDKILAARAAALLGEDALNRRAPAEAINWLGRAIALEPREVDLRVALAIALMAAGKADIALQVRDDALRSLPPSFEVLQRMASLSYRIGQTRDKANTLLIANAAINLGQVLPAVSADAWQIAALTAARANLDLGNMDTAAAIYNGLASSQWNWIGRAIALLDWEANLRNSKRDEEADQVNAKLAALRLSAIQLRTAKSVWASLD